MPYSPSASDSILQGRLPHATSLVLFSRFPEAGKVKTRLAWRIGDGAAASIHHYMLNSVVETLMQRVEDVNIVLNYTGAPCEDSMRQALNPGIDSELIHFIEQPNTSFGGRINAIAKRLNKVVIVSSDIPQLSIEQLDEAIAHVRNNRSTIGLTADGGYYLIGLPEYRDVFTAIDYRAQDVGQQTLALLQHHFDRAHPLQQMLIDVDEERDLQSLGLDHLTANYVDISVIIPVLNESDTILITLEHIIATADDSDRIEIIVVDGQSRDQTPALVDGFKERFPELKLHIFAIPSLGRSFQMNYGYRRSSGRFSLFCHADTWLPKHWDRIVKSSFLDTHLQWCSFSLRYDHSHPALRWIAWIANNVRRVPYGDQALCFRRDYFSERGKFDYLTLFEDARFMYIKVPLRDGRRLPQPVFTSARMYADKRGKLSCGTVISTLLKNNAILIAAWLFKIPPCLLKSVYYRYFKALNIVEVEFLTQRYAFRYHYPTKLRHKIMIWKVLYYQHAMDDVIGAILKYSKGNDIIVDVGANVGILSILLAMTLTRRNINSDIVAFEPVPTLCASFHYNQSLYRREIKNRITLENLALSQQSGQHYYLHANGELSYLTAANHRGALTTEAIALDDYHFEDRPISVIKLDIEGHELAALRGMKKILCRHKPAVLFEVLSRPMTAFLGYPSTSSKSAITDFFDSIGYRVNKISRVDYVALPNDRFLNR